MTKPLAMTKLRNQLTTLNADLTIELRNIRINGDLRGCSGFITDPDSGAVVYVSTEPVFGQVRQFLYRTAKSNRDYSGGRNRYATPDELPRAVIDLLKTGVLV